MHPRFQFVKPIWWMRSAILLQKVRSPMTFTDKKTLNSTRCRKRHKLIRLDGLLNCHRIRLLRSWVQAQVRLTLYRTARTSWGHLWIGCVLVFWESKVAGAGTLPGSTTPGRSQRSPVTLAHFHRQHETRQDKTPDFSKIQNKNPEH